MNQPAMRVVSGIQPTGDLHLGNLLGAILYVILHRRGHFRIERWLASRLARQLVAAAVMVVALLAIRTALADWFDGSLGQRLAGVTAIVGGGMIVYVPLVWLLGGTDKEELRSLLRRRRPYTDAG